MKADELSERLLEFAVRVLNLVEALPRKRSARHAGDQLLLAGTSPGANYEEARAAESTADFSHKCQIVLKELRESRYWIRVISRAGLVQAQRVAALLAEGDELVLIFSKSVATLKGKSRPKFEI
ncbi:MAG: four helix bundle protein [Planctomycetes bacterium]|nr:four helix bundle protein [Planctomycetota bacterium]